MEWNPYSLRALSGHIRGHIDGADGRIHSSQAGHFSTEAWTVVDVGRYVGHFVEQDALCLGKGKCFQKDPTPLFITIAGDVFTHFGGHTRHDEWVVERYAVCGQFAGEI